MAKASPTMEQAKQLIKDGHTVQVWLRASTICKPRSCRCTGQCQMKFTVNYEIWYTKPDGQYILNLTKFQAKSLMSTDQWEQAENADKASKLALPNASFRDKLDERSKNSKVWQLMTSDKFKNGYDHIVC